MSDRTQLAQAVTAELDARRVEAWDLQAAAMFEINRIRAEIRKAVQR